MNPLFGLFGARRDEVELTVAFHQCLQLGIGFGFVQKVAAHRTDHPDHAAARKHAQGFDEALFQLAGDAVVGKQLLELVDDDHQPDRFDVGSIFFLCYLAESGLQRGLQQRRIRS